METRIVAQPGDTVENLTTGQVLEVVGQTNSGRLRMDTGAKWERWNVRVISRNEQTDTERSQ